MTHFNSFTFNMSSKGVICAMLMVVAFPRVQSFGLRFVEAMVNIETRLLNDNVYEFGLQKVDGGMTTLKEMGYKGHPMIIINLPYNCDPRRIFTLNMLMAQYYDEGLRIIAFPTEEFSDLYPIDRFLSTNILHRYIARNHFNFDVFNIIHVNYPDEDQLWRYLRASQDLYKSEITEDYTMFIIDKTGRPVRRLPGTPMISFEKLNSLIQLYL